MNTTIFGSYKDQPHNVCAVVACLHHPVHSKPTRPSAEGGGTPYPRHDRPIHSHSQRVRHSSPNLFHPPPSCWRHRSSYRPSCIPLPHNGCNRLQPRQENTLPPRERVGTKRWAKRWVPITRAPANLSKEGHRSKEWMIVHPLTTRVNAKAQTRNLNFLREESPEFARPHKAPRRTGVIEKGRETGREEFLSFLRSVGRPIEYLNKGLYLHPLPALNMLSLQLSCFPGNKSETNRIGRWSNHARLGPIHTLFLGRSGVIETRRPEPPSERKVMSPPGAEARKLGENPSQGDLISHQIVDNPLLDRPTKR